MASASLWLAARMAAVVVSESSAPTALLTNQDFSEIFGSISLTAWICLLIPQLITNYKLQSADAISMGFLCLWLLGDVTNLAGALSTGLAPTAILLASYFCCSDVILLSQCIYYNRLNARRGRSSRRQRPSTIADSEPESDAAADDELPPPGEQDPLISSRRRSSSLGLPGSHRRQSIRHDGSNLDPLTRVITGEDETPDRHPWLNNFLGLVAVWVVGAAGWFIAKHMGTKNASVPDVGGDDESGATSAASTFGVVMGVISAVCYLCARLPQIWKNYQDKSCEGLSPLFFLLSTTGNLTYGFSIVTYSQDSDYLAKAIPWLLGSQGTIIMDLVIFAQFHIYASPSRRQQKADTHEEA